MDKAANQSPHYGDTSCWFRFIEVMTLSTTIRSSMYVACAFFTLALLGCTKHMLTVNIINNGPPLHAVTIHYRWFGARTMTADLLPTGGELSRTIYYHENGNVWWSYRTSDGRDMMAGSNLYLLEADNGVILNIVDPGGSTRTLTSGLRRGKPSQNQEQQQNHTAPHPSPPRKAPTPAPKPNQR